MAILSVPLKFVGAGLGYGNIDGGVALGPGHPYICPLSGADQHLSRGGFLCCGVLSVEIKGLPVSSSSKNPAVRGILSTEKERRFIFLALVFLAFSRAPPEEKGQYKSFPRADFFSPRLPGQRVRGFVF